MTPSRRAQSRAVRASGPTTSNECDIGIAPRRLTRPFVGTRPTTPETAARHSDRAARIRAQRRMDHAAADGDAGAARRAAGDVLRIPGIATLRIILIVAVRSHGELDHDEAAEIDGAGPVEPAERRGGAGRPPVGPPPRFARRHPARAGVAG